MAIAAPHHDHRGPGLLPVSRSRNLRMIVIAGVLLIVVWTLRGAPILRAHKSKYKSKFELVNPSHPPPAHTPAPAAGAGGQPSAAAAPGPKQPIALPGDSFYLTDATHAALTAPAAAAPPAEEPPPPPPPAPEREFPASVAVIMETDPSAVPNLVPIMLHFANVLGPDWPVVLVTLEQNWVEPPSPAFRRLMAERRVRIFFLPPDVSFPDHASVSKFFTTPWLWERFESADRVLLFQADSVLCGRSARRVEDFLEWDLVGAPVARRYGVGYNGGLSLRNPKLLLEIVRDPALNTFAARLDEIVAAEDAAEAAGLEQPKVDSWERFEDQWFYVKLRALGERARLPGPDVAGQFAVETIWAEEPLGYHQPFRWLMAWQKTKALEWCPEVAMLQEGGRFFGPDGEEKNKGEKTVSAILKEVVE